MSIKVNEYIKKFKLNYFNFLYFLTIPSFVVGQFLFKLIFILIVISGIIKYQKKIFLFEKNFINNFFILMMLFFCINVLIVSSYYYSLNLRFLFFVMIILFFLVTDYLIKNQIIDLKKIFIFNLYVLMFVIFDTIYQIVYLRDIFGYEIYQNYQRYSGPFGDEFILGAFMSFFLLPTILFYLQKKNFNFYKYIFIYLFFLISIYISIKSGERIAFLTILIQLILAYIFFLKRKKFKLFVLIFTIILTFSLIIVDKGIQKKYAHFYQLIFNYNEKILDKSSEINFNNLSFFNTQHGAHYLTAFEIWKNNKIFGIGIKNFRNESADKKYSQIKSAHAKYRSATHPHNYQMELLSETGLVGFIIFNVFFLILLIKVLKNILNKNNRNYYISIFFIIIFSKYFPIKSDASLFSSSMGLLFWMFTVFLIASLNIKDVNYFNRD